MVNALNLVLRVLKPRQLTPRRDGRHIRLALGRDLTKISAIHVRAHLGIYRTVIRTRPSIPAEQPVHTRVGGVLPRRLPVGHDIERGGRQGRSNGLPVEAIAGESGDKG